MALGALISLSFQLDAPARGVRKESKNLNIFTDIRPTAIQPFPFPSGARQHDAWQLPHTVCYRTPATRIWLAAGIADTDPRCSWRQRAIEREIVS
jgi:hypothetical protein